MATRLFALVILILMSGGGAEASISCTVGVPLVSFPMSQSECAAGVFVDEISETFTLTTARSNGSRCITRGGFPAVTGGFEAQSSTLANNTISTLPCTSSGLVDLSVPGLDLKSITIEMRAHSLVQGSTSGARNYLMAAGWSTTFSRPLLGLFVENGTVGLGVSLVYRDTGSVLRLAEWSVPFGAQLGTVISGGGGLSPAGDIVFNASLYLAAVISSGTGLSMYVGNPDAQYLMRTNAPIAPDVTLDTVPFTATDLLSIGTRPQFPSASPTALQNANLGMPGDYQYLGVYMRALSVEDVVRRYRTALVNSSPSTHVVQNLVILQNATVEVSLTNTSLYTFDFERDEILFVEITALPGNGGLYLSNASDPDSHRTRITAAGTGFDPRYTKLTYYTEALYAWTLESGVACSDTTQYARFTFRSSDATGTSSATGGAVRICLENIQDSPIPANVTLTNVYFSQRRMFSIEFSDTDYLTARANYSAYERIMFTSTTIGTYGRLRRSLTGAACDGAYAAPGFWYPWVVHQGRTQFRFCYETYTQNVSLYGQDVFPYKVRDETGLENENPVFVVSEGVAPLEVCSDPPYRNLSLLTGADAACASRGVEGSGLYIPIYLQTSDHYSTYTGLVPARVVRMYLTSIPTRGSLFLANATTGERTGSALTLSAAQALVIPSLAPTSLLPSLWYLAAEPTYFNRVGSGGFANGLGQGLDGCALASCRCSIAVYPGCPDTFTYYATATDVSSGALPLQRSPANGTYAIYIESKITPISDVSTTIGLTFARSTSSFVQPYFPRSAPISFVDHDDNVYKVGVTLWTDVANVEMAINLTTAEAAFFLANTDDSATTPVPLFTGNWTLYKACGYSDAPFQECMEITVYAYPSQLNEVLARFMVIARTTTLANDTTRAYVYFYQPEPDGATDALASDMLNQFLEVVEAREIGLQTPIRVTSADTDFRELFKSIFGVIVVLTVFAIIAACIAAYKCCGVCESVCCCCCNSFPCLRKRVDEIPCCHRPSWPACLTPSVPKRCRCLCCKDEPEDIYTTKKIGTVYGKEGDFTVGVEVTMLRGGKPLQTSVAPGGAARPPPPPPGKASAVVPYSAFPGLRNDTGIEGTRVPDLSFDPTRSSALPGFVNNVGTKKGQ